MATITARSALAHDLAMALDPAVLMQTGGLPPDPWQAALLRSAAPRLLLLCCRQSGKSTTTASLALHTAASRAERVWQTRSAFAGMGIPSAEERWAALRRRSLWRE
jgi:hypothetical protein